MADTTIRELRASRWNVELTESFGIATGAQARAENVLVRVTLSDGTVGLGEAAPFPAVNGETQEDAVLAVSRAAEALRGLDAERFRVVADAAREAATESPSARAAIETAVLDAFTKRANLSLWKFFGGAEETLETDITIVTGGPAHARAAAERAIAAGFSTLKIKVGGVPLEEDVARMAAIVEVAPHARLVLDANAALSVDEAVELVERIGKERVALFEQPVARDDLQGMRAVRRRTRVRVAADESIRSPADVSLVAFERAADVVNVKVTKCGVAEACDIVAACRSFNLGLMIGGMVETKLAMSLSACLAAGRGGFEFVDLDTPLFMKEGGMLQEPTGGSGPVAATLAGGYEQSGSTLRVSSILCGHGVTVTC
ncbi:MAG TPA: dipeptide epimerase [Polyangiaceae bacterium]|nr:dipeptide epimerase [Polyangiaceae bacterium]